MKTLKVAAAIIIKGNKIFATQRGCGEFQGKWEFPGGKLEEGETSAEAVKREIMEELDILIEVGRLIETVEYDYPEFHLSMDCFLCRITDGVITLKEHRSAKWLTRKNLGSVDWLMADRGLIETLQKCTDGS